MPLRKRGRIQISFLSRPRAKLKCEWRSSSGSQVETNLFPIEDGVVNSIDPYSSKKNLKESRKEEKNLFFSRLIAKSSYFPFFFFLLQHVFSSLSCSSGLPAPSVKSSRTAIIAMSSLSFLVCYGVIIFVKCEVWQKNSLVSFPFLQ